jgi:hypothetical protein
MRRTCCWGITAMPERQTVDTGKTFTAATLDADLLEALADAGMRIAAGDRGRSQRQRPGCRSDAGAKAPHQAGEGDGGVGQAVKRFHGDGARSSNGPNATNRHSVCR